MAQSDNKFLREIVGPHNPTRAEIRKLPATQRVKWRANSALSDGNLENVNLSGGYYDAGDNVKFGWPMAFSVSLLSWAATEYKNEINSAKQLPNLRSAIKWGTDFLIRAHTSSTTLYTQAKAIETTNLGSGGRHGHPEHRIRSLPLRRNRGGGRGGRPCRAIVFRDSIPNILATPVTPLGNGNIEDLIVDLAHSIAPIRLSGGLLYTRDSSNLQYVTSASMILLVYSKILTEARADGVQCGSVKFSASKIKSFAKSQVDYILGSNPLKMSYMVGFGSKYPTQLHHRGASIPSIQAHPAKVGCSDGLSTYYSSSKPNPNIHVGAIVGGPDSNDHFTDSRSDFHIWSPQLI
ncbi:hypothetical protein DH2020_028859 [Rehmannia glutinosa]|uniref:Endoglucanase n=1 Tax=Rehmannia glutinosa TaxID=99300 RepID=A0ABR0VQ68_REHGL